jgi:phosphate transport system permease protein
MTTVEAGSLQAKGIKGATLPPWALAATVVAGVAVTVVLFALTGFAGRADFLVVAAIVAVAAVGMMSWRVEGRRRAVDRVATSGALLALLLTLLPLGFVIGYVIKAGKTRFNLAFLTHSMANIGPLDSNGGVYHAAIGTLEQVLLASLIAVPLGLMVAIYITEYGGNALATSVRFLIDVMTGIPSIVAGLFVLAFWIIALNQPDSLREASYALGVPKWKTVLRIVLPTASTGITTGVMLAIARVIGETAPVLLVVGGNNFINNNPFSGAQGSLPLFIFQNALTSSTFNVQRAWAAALTLILIVVVLYVAARLLTRRNALARR